MPSDDELDDIEVLHQTVQQLIARGLTTLGILVTWFGRRIQPLRARAHLMYDYGVPFNESRSSTHDYTNAVLWNVAAFLVGGEESNMPIQPEVVPYCYFGGMRNCFILFHQLHFRFQ